MVVVAVSFSTTGMATMRLVLAMFHTTYTAAMHVVMTLGTQPPCP